MIKFTSAIKKHIKYTQGKAESYITKSCTNRKEINQLEQYLDGFCNKEQSKSQVKYRMIKTLKSDNDLMIDTCFSLSIREKKGNQKLQDKQKPNKKGMENVAFLTISEV